MSYGLGTSVACAILSTGLLFAPTGGAAAEITWSFPDNISPGELSAGSLTGKASMSSVTFGKRARGTGELVYYLDKPVSLTLGEKGDEPCAFWWKSQGSYNSYGEASNYSEDWIACGGSRSKKVLSWGRENALTAIRVCTNNKTNARGQLVKGIQVQLSRRETPTGPLEVVDTREIKQPNCKKWSSNWSRCTGNMAASGITLYYKRIGGKDSITGFRLLCWNTVPFDPDSG